MSEKVKVYNRTKGNYGIKLPSNVEYNIRPGSFIPLTKDDIAYVESQCAYNKKPFATGRLVIEEQKKVDVSEELGIIPDEKNFFESDEDIDKKLKGTVKNFKKWLEGIEDQAMLFNIAERAKALDLPASKLKILNEKVPSAGLLD